MNYRPSLWKTIGGLKKAQEVNREIAKYVDVMIGNEEDFTASLGFAVKGQETLGHIETDAFKAMIETAVKEFPNFKVAATTLRHVITATKNDWSAILWHDGKFHESKQYPGLEILDRVGGGDSFASGVQFGSWNSTTRRRRLNTVPLTVPSLRPRPAIRAWPPARKWKKPSAEAGRGFNGKVMRLIQKICG